MNTVEPPEGANILGIPLGSCATPDLYGSGEGARRMHALERADTQNVKHSDVTSLDLTLSNLIILFSSSHKMNICGGY